MAVTESGDRLDDVVKAEGFITISVRGVIYSTLRPDKKHRLLQDAKNSE